MALLFTEEEAQLFPIFHLSYSSIRTYLTNRSEFKKRYIDANYSQDTNMGMLVGNALHEAMAKYYIHQKDGIKGFNTREDVIEMANRAIYDLVVSKNVLIKGFTPEKKDIMLEDAYSDIEIAVNGHFDNLPNFPKILGVEVQDKVLISYNGFQYPIGLKAIIDIFYYDEEGRLCIFDHKFVELMEAEGMIKPDFDFQAGACYFIAMSLFGEIPYSMTYNQVSKRNVNPFKGLVKADLIKICVDNEIELDWKEKKDGTINCQNKVDEIKQKIIDRGIVKAGKQVIPYTIIYEEKPYIIDMFVQTFENILNEIWIISNNDMKFLPNVFDMLSGKSSYQEYILETTGYDLVNPKSDMDLELDF